MRRTVTELQTEHVCCWTAGDLTLKNTIYSSSFLHIKQVIHMHKEQLCRFIDGFTTCCHALEWRCVTSTNKRVAQLSWAQHWLHSLNFHRGFIGSTIVAVRREPLKCLLKLACALKGRLVFGCQNGWKEFVLHGCCATQKDDCVILPEDLFLSVHIYVTVDVCLSKFSAPVCQHTVCIHTIWPLLIKWR